MTDLADQVRQDGLLKADQLAQVAAANQTVDDLQGRLSEIAAAVGSTEFSGDNSLTNTLAALLQAANTAAAVSYPYSGQDRSPWLD